jgi:hypothetical protein
MSQSMLCGCSDQILKTLDSNVRGVSFFSIHTLVGTEEASQIAIIGDCNSQWKALENLRYA